MSEPTEQLAAPGASRQTAITRKGGDIRDLIQSDHFKAQVALALPKHMNADRFARVVLTALTRTPKLLECTKESLLRCCMDLSQIGLEADGRNAHLIPFKKSTKDKDGKWQSVMECQLIVDWKGYVALARRSGDVSVFRPVLLKEKDDFDWVNGTVTHRIDWRNPRGKTQAVYSYVKFKDGREDWEVMTLDEVEQVRKRSKAANDGPWVNDFDEMAKKTVIRRHSKRLDITPEFEAAEQIEDTRERQATGREIMPALVPSVPSQIEDARFSAINEAEAEKPLDQMPEVVWGEPEAQHKKRMRKQSGGAEAQASMCPRDTFGFKVGAAGIPEVIACRVLAENGVAEVLSLDLLTEDEAAAALGQWETFVKLCKEDAP